MSWVTNLKEHIQKINNSFVSNHRECFLRDDEESCLVRKIDHLHQRDGKIVKSIVDGTVLRTQKIDGLRQVDYVVHFQHLIKQQDKFHIEEKIEERRAIFSGEELLDDYCPLSEKKNQNEENALFDRETSEFDESRFQYSRLEAVRYAERWWNDYNPNYKKFDDNCTNFISQCLHAGGAPMVGYPNRSKGWWFRNRNWSLSWSVAHSLRWHLSGAKTGLRAKEMSSPKELMKGDVICYDFNGDGRWQHNTIVVAKDANNEPLVNAQTSNSRMRYWAYQDSTAYTPNIKYKFFHIIDG
ncbi:amidase domain-containing protein [Anaerobacillus sp. CMMVII]|uniref:amidase domain-containing protein n=1 Tax=Anaerobacillus sp. CMMVII TaxID=2755588 RepID=UPI0021B72A6A|nr:amidase domain-containing protein [Anaerobacillus sp. CMMVII]MCT8136993.1 amidase domain-containing protein [Anaerobacillus sp. CMMVII]